MPLAVNRTRRRLVAAFGLGHVTQFDSDGHLTAGADDGSIMPSRPKRLRLAVEMRAFQVL